MKLVLAEAALSLGDPQGAHQHARAVAAHWPHSAAVWNVYARTAAALGGLRHNLKFFAPLRQKHPGSLPLAVIIAHQHTITVRSAALCQQL